MTAERRQRFIAGFGLIALGLVLYAFRNLRGVGEAAAFFVIGGVFLTFYFSSRHFGLLIPACILLGVGGGRVAETLDYTGNATLLGMGSGFVAIYVIASIYEKRSHWWPLVPGAALILAGLPEGLGIARGIRFLFSNWPLILVVVGVFFVLAALATPRRRE